MKTNKQVILPFAAIFSFLILFACDSRTTNDKQKFEEPEKVSFDLNEPELEEIAVLRKCYTGNVNNLEVSMNLELEGELVTGELTYKSNENIVKFGNVTGEFSSDTLFVSFKYLNNEEENITEELVFMENPKTYKVIQGSAKTEKRGNLIKILDFNNINFDGPVFEKFDCDQIEIK